MRQIWEEGKEYEKDVIFNTINNEHMCKKTITTIT